MRTASARGGGYAVAWDSTPQPRRGQGLLLVLAALALLPAVASAVLRVFPPADDATALVASFISYGIVGDLVGLVLLVGAAVRARRRLVLSVGVVLVLALTAAHLSWLAPLFVPDHRAATTPGFTLMSANIHNGGADPGEIAAQAERADVVVLIETTPDSLRALKPYGWDERFPYAVGDLRQDLSDTAIYSRFPLAAGILIGPTSFQQWSTSVRAPGIGTINLVAAHPCNPFCGGNRWHSEHAALRAVLRPRLSEPLIVAGDFNAVEDHGPMQTLRADGLRSATDLTGSGWLPTYPAGRALPPLLPIDHILLSRQLTATSLERFELTGSDHLGLLATIAGSG